MSVLRVRGAGVVFTRARSDEVVRGDFGLSKGRSRGLCGSLGGLFGRLVGWGSVIVVRGRPVF